MSIKKPAIHSMNRRSYYCDYSGAGVYHVTLKTAEALRHPLHRQNASSTVPLASC